jgi:hypothetical protein
VHLPIFKVIRWTDPTGVSYFKVSRVKTAKPLNIDIPESLLLRADEVVE